MKTTNYHIIDRDGELFNEEGETEREAYNTMRYLSQEQGMRGLKVVRRDQLSVEQQAKLKEYEDKLATEIARGKNLAA